MFICVICHFAQVMWPIELVFKINIFFTGRGKCFKNRKKTFYFIIIIKKSYLYQALYLAKTWRASLWYSWHVLALRTRFTFSLSWF